MQLFSVFLTVALLALATVSGAVPLTDVSSHHVARAEPLVAVNSPAVIPTQRPHTYMRRARAHP
ncbi:hypothetical protein BD310DRAFT_928243 [Dichomitus squalens]|uniref:Uncharacterized protein n=1 Tax=Dichomitus squalens TaxID=114155 RepID=A0A4Q9PTZ9_9APHY|nr:hypothetical protein BD310DRAFT_928243 [Dichomitus squalens]